MSLAVVALACGTSLSLGQSRRDSEGALQGVRKEIAALSTRLARETARRDDGVKELKAAELASGAASAELATIRGELSTQQQARRDLGREVGRVESRLAAERAALADQVRASYMTGHEELFKLLLSQESPATLGRMLAYYDYYNRARTARIAAVLAELTSLAALRERATAVEDELAALEAAQAAKVTTLERSRDERRAAIAKIDSEINDASAAIAKLRAEESRLADLVKQLGEALAGFPVDTDQPFAALKGKLAWPIQGRLTGDFGQPRGSGPVRWNGVLLEASAGTPVRAVYHGRVAFADWLPGLGLLAIVDHGGGYMSLYGYNEALLKEAGDWVEPGEALAQVGDTGGQARAGLYFEIRHNGAPIDPNPWLVRRAPGR